MKQGQVVSVKDNYSENLYWAAKKLN